MNWHAADNRGSGSALVRIGGSFPHRICANDGAVLHRLAKRTKHAVMIESCIINSACFFMGGPHYSLLTWRTRDLTTHRFNEGSFIRILKFVKIPAFFHLPNAISLQDVTCNNPVVWTLIVFFEKEKIL